MTVPGYHWWPSLISIFEPAASETKNLFAAPAAGGTPVPVMARTSAGSYHRSNAPALAATRTPSTLTTFASFHLPANLTSTVSPSLIGAGAAGVGGVTTGGVGGVVPGLAGAPEAARKS